MPFIEMGKARGGMDLKERRGNQGLVLNILNV